MEKTAQGLAKGIESEEREKSEIGDGQ